MGRYSGTLHKLIDSASSSNSKTKWNQVLHYLEGHTVGNAGAHTNPSFDSPLPPYSAPSVELEVELFDQQGPKREDSPLKIAIRHAPAVVVAALCHLGPEASRMADSRERLPMHWACRRSSEDPETEKVLVILAKCNPESFLHRDDGGRTPLHWLFWYHAPSRSAKIVKFFCQRLPVEEFKDISQPRNSSAERYPLPEIPIPSSRGEIPPNSAIVPDGRHGAIPLHYAVMQGAQREAIKALILEYPASLAYGDRKGRTPLAWYLGAGHLLDNNKRHICGESNDPSATPWWYVKLSPNLIQLLISSKVARTVDDIGRTPLHWACHFFARSTVALEGASMPTKAFQIILDNNVQAVTTQDSDAKTPLHVLFDVIGDLQENDHKRKISNRTMRDDIDLTKGGPAAFNPPKQLVELLLKSPDADGQHDQGFRFDPGREDRISSAAHVEDTGGFLPIHTALRVATNPDIIQLLIQYNPTSLVHTSEELLQTPLVQAYCYPHTAPLQPAKTFALLMAAYVTSRHGTFMDGRLALKMEDSLGSYPLHYACQNHASLETIELFVERFPRCALFLNAEGDLPLHLLLSQEFMFDPPENGIIDGASVAQPIGLLTEKEATWQQQMKKMYREKMRVLMEPLVSPEHLKLASSAHGMTPLHIAVAFDVLPYHKLYQVLDSYPQGAGLRMTMKGYEFSCLDLHELKKNDESDIDDQWYVIKELLFAFYPLVDEYRHKDELLEACVKLIRSEVMRHGSYHLQQAKDLKAKSPANIDLSETLSTIAAPEIDCAYRPKQRGTNAATPTKKKIQVKSPAHSQGLNLTSTFSFGGKKKKVEKSIYDDDGLGDRYVVSPQNSEEDDDEDFLSSEEEEEEYFSDESGGSETDSVEGTATSFEQSARSSWDQGFNSGPSGTLTDRSSWGSPKSGASSPSKGKSHRGKGKRSGKSSIKYAEEKKEDASTLGSPPSEMPFLSEVATRLWCFFVLYNDPKNPEDSYIRQVEAVVEDMEFQLIEGLMNLPLPSYAQEFLEEGTSTAGVTLRDVASPTSKALFHSHHYFLGRYEFPTEIDGMLLHRSIDNNTVSIKAFEHVIKTKEYQAATELAPGTAEEAIWTTGERIEEEEAYMASRFRDLKRPVFFKFSRNRDAFENEVKCREQLGLSLGDESPSNIFPLIDSFSALDGRKKDRRYKMDANDDRFQTLHLFGGESIRLSDYSFAMVYPHCEEGDLFDYFFHHGLEGMDEVADIGLQVGKALTMMHEQGVIHGNISMRNIAMLPLARDSPTPHRTWAVSDLSSVCRAQVGGTAYLGCVSPNGSAQFETGLLPPEMFVKLTAAEARIYQTYWEMVDKLYDVKVDERIVEPYVNLETGSTYVLRCHYVPDKDSEGNTTLPTLPYQLVPARECTDLWCFGLMLFTLCSGGRPLFSSNMKTGHLLDYESIVSWDLKFAAASIYERVEDPLAQDLLLHLLSPYEERVNVTMEAVLNHPFFTNDGVMLGKMIDHRQHESAAHDRWRKQVVSEKSEDDWLQSRTTTVTCWNFDLLRKIHFSTSQIVRKLVGKDSAALAMPCSFLLLPYKLSAKNKKAKLAPTTKKDVERAERMGVLLLSLGKTCFFASKVNETINGTKKIQWTASKLMDEVALPSADFDAVKEDFMKLAAAYIEAFRADPVSAVYKLVERRVAEIRKFFKDSAKAFLYLVDEHVGIPLVGSAYAPYPLAIDDSLVDQLLTKALPFMYACTLNALGSAGGVSGVVRLIFEAAYPHIPPSWAHASSGLTHALDEEKIIKEVNILHDSLADLSSSNKSYIADDLQLVRDSCLRLDKRGTFADMQRVECAGHSFWTTREGAAEIQESCQSYGFHEAFEIQATLESKLKTQEQNIKKLQEQMERLKFRRDLNLEVPEDESPVAASTAGDKENTPKVKSPRAEGTKVPENKPETLASSSQSAGFFKGLASPANSVATEGTKASEKLETPTASSQIAGFFKGLTAPANSVTAEGSKVPEKPETPPVSSPSHGKDLKDLTSPTEHFFDTKTSQSHSESGAGELQKSDSTSNVSEKTDGSELRDTLSLD